MLTKRLRSAKTLARQGNLLSALKQLQELKSMAPKQPTMKRDLFITDAMELEAQWLGNVNLVAYSGNEQYLEPGQTPGPLKVQVVMQSDNDTSVVRNFPVVFMSGSLAHILPTAFGLAGATLPDKFALRYSKIS